jgi:hypothetical protein
MQDNMPSRVAPSKTNRSHRARWPAAGNEGGTVTTLMIQIRGAGSRQMRRASGKLRVSKSPMPPAGETGEEFQILQTREI